MEIGGQKFLHSEPFDRIITVPDCFVVRNNKIGGGNGEAKLYISSKEGMVSFFGNGSPGFHGVPCFLLKQDLIRYLQAAEPAYLNPKVRYANTDAARLRELWDERMRFLSELNEVIPFSINDQDQIAGPRGYIKSSDFGYELIRELSLPFITYISVMKLQERSGRHVYYFKLFVDYEAMGAVKNGPMVYKYGRAPKEQGREQQEETAVTESSGDKRARVGQDKYRAKLLLECPFCPITMVNDERLLIASHIKPWAVSNDKEKIDPKNGFILSPLYDRLFDQGFITFTDERYMEVSNWLSPSNQKRLALERKFIQLLPIDDERKKYLEYHRKYVFKG